MTPGTGRTTYDALVGPLAAGAHRITFERSTLWSWPAGLEIAKVSPRVVATGSEASVVLGHSPTLGIRADTIGTASDVPLVLYAEDDRRNGRGWIRYSVIISHEDGGTPAPALMARWGRTTDIELIYEVEMDGTRVVQDRFQGPDHEVRRFAGAREGQPSATLDRHAEQHVHRSRKEPRERAAGAAHGQPRSPDARVGHGRQSLDLPADGARARCGEAHRHADRGSPRVPLCRGRARISSTRRSSVKVGSDAAGWKDSTRGRADLAVNRNGWVRIAVHAPSRAATLKWECRAIASAAAGAVPRCRIEWGRVFRLGQDYLPGENMISPGSVQLGVGLSDAVTAGGTIRQRE